MKIVRFIAGVVLPLGLSACQPPQQQVTADGKPCHPIGYSWSPVWVGPDGKTWCSR